MGKKSDNMKKGYKKISFDTLQQLVANIDYVLEDSFPVVFFVDGRKYSCGIKYSPDEEQYLQYLLDKDDNLLDLQEADGMEWDAIGKMLKEKCRVSDTAPSRITLAVPLSFGGEMPNLYWKIRKYRMEEAAAKLEALKKTNKELTDMLLEARGAHTESTRKRGALQTVYGKVLKKAGRPFGCSSMTNHYRVEPKQLNLDNGKTLNVEWLQPSWFGRDVLVNWKTDSVKASSLSARELEQLAEIV